MIRLIAFLICLPMAGVAEPVSIRTGEHETFSRFVFAIGEGVQWTVQEAEGGFLLVLTGRSDGFNTTAVFERIPKDRVSAVTERTPSSLFFKADCQCFADAFLYRPGRLVVDIADGEDPNVQTRVIEESQSLGAMPTSSDTPLTLPNLLTLSSSRSPLPLVGVTGPFLAEVPFRSPDLIATQTALIEGLARAASQGFLNAAISPPPNAPEKPPARIEENTVEPVPEINVTPRQPGVGITTAMDRDLALIRSVIGGNVAQQCLSAELFQIDAWGDDRDFHEQAADLAEALVGQFGEEPLEAQDALARLYLHFGFGAEARAVVAADKAQSQERQILTELAGLIDNYEGNYALISAQMECDTPGAFWAFLNEPTQLEEQSRNHIMQEFFALPQPLRSQIAPRLARQFVDLGDVDAGEKLLRASENHDAEVTHDVQAARALVAEESNDRKQAIAVLSREADDNARTTPDSLIRLIELELANGDSPREADLILAAAMRQEHRETPVALRLAVAEAQGRGKRGEFQAVLDLLGDRQDQPALDTVDRAFVDMTERATAAVFLGFGFGEIPTGLTAETENLMARRMIDLGFPERASSLLRGPAEREAAAERRYLRAEAAIGAADYVAAIDELLGMSDERTRDLRAKAFTGLGEYRAALSALAQGGQTSDDATMQFRAGAWERLTIEQDEVLSSFAQAVLVPATTDPVETLADRRAILAQSQESRRAIESLLLRFDGFTAPD